jgi:beta-lactamase regulating signal transducer with metallopeptidase domain
VDIALNWLWQGVVVALAAGVVLPAIPRSDTQARYGFLWAACAAVLVLPVVPLMIAAASPAPPAGATVISLGPLIAMPTAWWTSPAFAVGFWISWTAVYAARLAAAGVALGATKRQSRLCPDVVENKLHHWSRVRNIGRRTRVVISTRVRSAAVLGFGSPTIALAPALLDQLSEADLDRVIVHEWAHVQRRDDVAQLVQLLLRMVVGWHPAIWWLERQLELEREVACDQIAVAVTGSAKGYASCLATLAALATGPTRSWLAPAAVSASGLRRRVVRILAAPPIIAARPWRTITIWGGMALSTLALAVGNVQVVELAATSLGLPGVVRPIASDMLAAPAPVTSHLAPQPTSSSSSAIARVSDSSDESARPAKIESSLQPAASFATDVTVEASASVTPWAFQSRESPLDRQTSGSIGTPSPFETPATSLLESRSTADVINSPPTDVMGRAPWTAAADAGMALGRSSQDAGVALGRSSHDVGVTIGRSSQDVGLATAGLFSRFGKKLAGSF